MCPSERPPLLKNLAARLVTAAGEKSSGAAMGHVTQRDGKYDRPVVYARAAAGRRPATGDRPGGRRSCRHGPHGCLDLIRDPRVRTTVSRTSRRTVCTAVID